VSILPPPTDDFPFCVDTLIVGAGCAGLVAALAADEAGQSVLVLERDAIPSGSTALSAGLIPAAGTRQQRAAGIADDAKVFAADIMKKAANEPDPSLVKMLTENAATVLEWLSETHGLAFTLVEDFDYPGHTNRRMHGLPSRSGEELINALREACEAKDILIASERMVDGLYCDGDLVLGVRASLPDENTEDIGCARLILACNGFGGNAAMVEELTPNIADAIYFGHTGNQGDAIAWGRQLGAQMADLGAYQGHGNVAHPHGILITWAVITQGGFQVNQSGERFWNEAQGYSEAARFVLNQPGGIAYAIFDERIAALAAQFKDFKDAQKQGAVKRADTILELAEAIGVQAEALQASFDSAHGTDAFGRTFNSDQPLRPPYCAVKVTGALFHTQGGLKVGAQARAMRRDGAFFPNLFATGGAAGGVSGSADSGYLSGNGLLAAAVLGYEAGRADHAKGV
jgi:fumarate reductase flavoprotein subunit